MKQNTAENELAIKAQRGTANETIEESTNIPREFAKDLRALGQAIEKFQFSAFDLQLESGIYIVTGKAISVENVKFSFAQFVFELLRGSNSTRTVTTTVGETELRFAPEEIEKFELRGKVKRQDSNKLPDPYSISQILRGAGSYLDHHDVTTLLGITLKDKWVTVSYQTSAGRLEQAKQDLEYFYNYWVKMYMRRSNRPRIPPPSDPTLCINWESIRNAHRFWNIPG
ncbi:MAG TPA: hypothetical protein VHV54_05535 [Candidatus Binatia bacterium]|nr:hypothetical protein [Candidatus Binatia bacterium]